MPRMALAFVLFGLTAANGPGARGSVITQTASLPLTQTDFGTGGKAESLTLQPFDTEGGTRVLEAVDVTVSAQIQNDFQMTFTTPATIKVSVASSNALAPGALITVDQPGGGAPLLSVQQPGNPSALTRMVTYGTGAGQTLPATFSSSLPTTSPYYLAPAVTPASTTVQLTSPADLKLFTGTAPVSLPVLGSAVSSFTSSSGNGSGGVTTQASANISVMYVWQSVTPVGTDKKTVPEPASLALWTLAGAGAWLLRRSRRRS